MPEPDYWGPSWQQFAAAVDITFGGFNYSEQQSALLVEETFIEIGACLPYGYE